MHSQLTLWLPCWAQAIRHVIWDSSRVHFSGVKAAAERGGSITNIGGLFVILFFRLQGNVLHHFRSSESRREAKHGGEDAEQLPE